MDKPARADVDVTHKAAEARDTWPVRIAGQMSEIADQPPLIAVSMATIIIGVGLRRGAVVRTGVRMLTAHALATGIKSVLKASIDRTRPKKAMKDGHHVGKGSGSGDTDLNSFPSGHTAGAVAVAEAIARGRPGAALPARLAAGAIAAIQMPRGKHYISDVLAGAAIGWASEAAASTALAAVERAAARFAGHADDASRAGRADWPGGSPNQRGERQPG